MALTFEINGVDRLAYLRDGTGVVDKVGGVEVFDCELWERTSPGASAYRPTRGQSVRVEHDSALLFGGEVVDVVERAVWGDAGVPTATVLRVTAVGRERVADRILIDRLTITGDDVLVIADDLCSTYLAPFGITNIGATSGGPTVPTIEVDHQTLSAVLARLQQHSGYVPRINGDDEFAMVAPGDLTGTAITTSNARTVERLTVQTSGVERVTRLFFQTGGSGTVTHTESRVGDGTATVFLLNVEPSVIPTEVDENGTPYALPSATWTYNSDLKAIVRASALGNGTPVSVSYAVDLPAWGRAWDASTTDSTGAWTASALVDGVVQLGDLTDVVEATAWARAEVARRVSEPQVVQVSTETPGYYPLQQIGITLTDMGVSGTFLVQSVRVRILTADLVIYDLTCIEGDDMGRTWLDYYRERPASTGGGIVVASTGGGGTVSGTASLQRIPLGGDNYRGDRPSGWTDIPNAIPIRFGGAAMAGTWTLRVYRRVTSTTSPTTNVDVRLCDVTNAVTLATIAGTSATTFTVGTTTFAAPLTEGVVILQYRVTDGGASPAEARIGQCSIERD
jgi:hypothetical protein